MKSLDYVIAASNIDNGSDFNDRLLNLNFVLKTFLKSQSDVDINVYIIEQVVNKNHPRFGTGMIIPRGLKVNYKVVYNPLFCRSWLFNIAVRISESENIFFADMDTWCNRDYFRKLIDNMDDKNLKWCFGFDKISLISKEQKENLILTGSIECDDSSNLLPQSKEVLSVPFDAHDKNNVRMHDLCYDNNGYIVPKKRMDEGKLVIFKRDFFLNEVVGGNELFKELGANDNDLAYRANRFSNTYETYPVVAGHLWHPLSTMKFAKSWDQNMMMIISILKDDNYIAMTEYLRSVKLGLDSGPLTVDINNIPYKF